MNAKNNNNIYLEKQYLFKNIGAIISILLLELTILIICIFVEQPPWSEIWPFCFIFFPIILLFTLRMNVEINKNYINVQIYPFFITEDIKWSEIENITVQKDFPKIRFKIFGNWNKLNYNKSYNVNGKYAIIITLKNGNIIGIGTQNHEESEYYIKYILKSHIQTQPPI